MPIIVGSFRIGQDIGEFGKCCHNNTNKGEKDPNRPEGVMENRPKNTRTMSQKDGTQHTQWHDKSSPCRNHDPTVQEYVVRSGCTRGGDGTQCEVRNVLTTFVVGTRFVMTANVKDIHVKGVL